MTTLTEAGISVLALTRYDRLGASSRLRMFAHIPALRAAGFRVTEAPLLNDAYLRALYGGRRPSLPGIARAYLDRVSTLLASRRHDVLWLEKEALPWLPLGVETLVGMGRIPYVMDIDDAWFERYAGHRLPIVRRSLGDKLAMLARGARIVTAGNPYLADWSRRSGARDVREVPTVVDLDRYPPPRWSTRGSDGPTVVGWIGTPTTARYLDLLAGVFARLGARARLRVVGAVSADFATPAEILPWTEEREVEDLASFDIGVMPLFDTPWERGKCGYKLIQYMAAGKPVVASPVGVNTVLVQDGVNGFLADGEDEWTEAIGRLAADPELRARMGAEGRRMVAENYCLTTAAPRLIAALRDAAG